MTPVTVDSQQPTANSQQPDKIANIANIAKIANSSGVGSFGNLDMRPATESPTCPAMRQTGD
jgi:hypothetical protein